MKKKIALMFGVVLLLVIGVFSTGFYPVAVVGKRIVLFRTWKKAQEGAMRVINVRAKSLKQDLIDFNASKNASLRGQIERSTLLLLVEDIIISKQGEPLVPDFEEKTKKLVKEAVASASISEQVTRSVYGLDLDTFERLVLIPQARRDLLNEALAGKHQEFEAWLADAKKQSAVRLLLVPFNWNGQEIR